MANYTTHVSDISKSQVMRAWLIGAAGTAGIHYFTVGKIKVGIIRVLVFLLCIGVVITGVTGEHDASTGPMIAMMLGILAILSLVDLAKIQLGKFRDNVGNYVRQP